MRARERSSCPHSSENAKAESRATDGAGGSYIVEVQRTRTGQKAGVSTRPYRFGEFDLLAVCMWASTGDSHSFLYAPAARLVADARDKNIIRTFQPVPHYENGDGDIWTKNLTTALERVS
jgi:hypothetical protein